MNASLKRAFRMASRLAAATVLLLAADPIGRAQDVTSGPAGISGHVFALVQGPWGGPQPVGIALPNAIILATNQTTNASFAAKTDASGRFVATGLSAGPYRLCTTPSGFNQNCPSDAVTAIAGATVASPDISVSPKSPYTAGRVLLSDDAHTPCYANRAAFGTSVAAELTLEGDTRGVSRSVNGNSNGEFVLPLPSRENGALHLVAACQQASARITLDRGQNASFNTIVLRNQPPSIERVDLMQDGNIVGTASPGAKVMLVANASSPDGGKLSYKWLDAAGNTLDSSSERVELRLPEQPTSTMVFVEVGDRRGGFAYSSVPVRSAAKEPDLVAGRVIAGTTLIGHTAAEVSGAPSVLLDGSPLDVDSNGQFTGTANPAPRHVVSARQTGYALLSQVTYGPAAQLQLPLQRVQAITFDLARGGTLSTSRDSGGLAVTLAVPENAFVDANNQPVTGMGTAFIWGYPAGTIPGDRSAIYRNNPALIQPYGAVDIQVFDSNRNPVELATGRSITLAMQAPAANLPSNVALFSYDEAKGIWVDEGTILSLSGGAYQGPVKKLKKVVGGVTPNMPSILFHSGCLQYNTNGANAPASPFSLLIVQGNSQQLMPLSDVTGSIYNLYPAQQVNWYVLPKGSSDPAQAIGSGTAPASDFVYNPLNANPFAAMPGYGSKLCNWFYPVAQYPQRIPFLTEANVYGPISGATYNSAVNTWAGFTATNLSTWKTHYGFPNGEISAAFYNEGELHLGRDAHCRQTNSGAIACYINNQSNFSHPPSGAAQSLKQAIKVNQGGVSPPAPLYTLAMAWEPGKCPGDTYTCVQFWAFDSADARATSVALDTEGPKSLPKACMTCHADHADPGGSTPNLASIARFLPFNLDTSLMAEDLFSASYVSSNNLTAYTHASQAAKFRQLNQLVNTTQGNQPNPITDLIAGWYASCGGVGNAACNACATAHCADSFHNTTYTPAGWSTGSAPPDFYHSVFRPYCRSCHISNTASFAWGNDYFLNLQSELLDKLVCTQNPRVMPNGEVQFKGFWQDSYAQSVVAGAIMNACPRQ